MAYRANRQKGSKPGAREHNFYPHLPQELVEEYRRFYASLSPDQIAKLGGVPHPSNLTGEVNPTFKYATTPEHWDYFSEAKGHASQGMKDVFLRALTYWQDRPVDQEEMDEAPPGHLHILFVLELIRKVLLVYTKAPDPQTRLHGEIVCLALGFPGPNCASLARKYKVSRQAVSKRLRNIIEGIGLPPTARMIAQASPVIRAILQAGGRFPGDPGRKDPRKGQDLPQAGPQAGPQAP